MVMTRREGNNTIPRLAEEPRPQTFTPIQPQRYLFGRAAARFFRPAACFTADAARSVKQLRDTVAGPNLEIFDQGVVLYACPLEYIHLSSRSWAPAGCPCRQRSYEIIGAVPDAHVVVQAAAKVSAAKQSYQTDQTGFATFSTIPWQIRSSRVAGEFISKERNTPAHPDIRVVSRSAFLQLVSCDNSTAVFPRAIR